MPTTSNISIGYYPEFIRYTYTDSYSGYIRSVGNIGSGENGAIITIEFISQYNQFSGQSEFDFGIGYFDTIGNMKTA